MRFEFAPATNNSQQISMTRLLMLVLALYLILGSHSGDRSGGKIDDSDASVTESSAADRLSRQEVDADYRPQRTIRAVEVDEKRTALQLFVNARLKRDLYVELEKEANVTASFFRRVVDSDDVKRQYYGDELTRELARNNVSAMDDNHWRKLQLLTNTRFRQLDYTNRLRLFLLTRVNSALAACRSGSLPDLFDSSRCFDALSDLCSTAGNTTGGDHEQCYSVMPFWRASLSALNGSIDVETDVTSLFAAPPHCAMRAAGAELLSPCGEPRRELRGNLARAFLLHRLRVASDAWSGVSASVRTDIERWLRTDPVDAVELVQHAITAAAQGARNPFVDFRT
jgi:hypothetical protein